MIPARDMAKMNGNDGGNGSSSELAIGQPNIMIDGELQPLDTSEGEMARIRDHELMESRSGSDNGGSGDDHDRNQRPGKKRVHRHTPYQIQELEAFFKACPHPDDKHRKEIGRQLGLEPLQVKFWFQNKRTQIKAQQERHENTLRRAENERLRADNRRLRDNLCNATCPNCGGPAAVGGDIMCLDDDHHLWFENARLREEVDRISAIAAKYVGKPVMDCPLLSPPVTPHSLDLEIGPFGDHPGIGAETNGSDRELFRSVAEVDIPAIMELAVAAMEELMKMAQMGEPLWMPKTDGSSFLNEEEYVRTFPGGIIGSKPLGFRTEASRESGVVIINSNKVVEILMDVNQWSTMFSAIVSRVATLEVVSAGVARNYNGALQIMTAEFQVPSPLVPTRKSYFLRYSKQHINHTWVVVDVSFDGLRPTPLEECRRRPSGCLIQEMPNGHSKVTWVEHVEVEDRCVHNLYRSLVGGGLAFGAKRWVSTLIRQCERQSSTVATNVPTNSIVSQEGRQSLLKLAERMVMSFSAGVGASTAHKWTNLSVDGDEGVRVMTHKSVDDPGRPPGIVLNAATSFWLPNSPRRVFNFLCDYNSRSEWDILSNGGAVQRMAHIANGPESDNCVSLL